LYGSLAVLVVAMFFASFPMPTSTAAMQTLAPNQLRAQISALFLLVQNLLALGLGTTIVALFTDKVFASPLAVGHSVSIVNGCAATLAVVLLGVGCRHYRESLAREQKGIDQAKNSAIDTLGVIAQ
jgi:hypothetical protein